MDIDGSKEQGCENEDGQRYSGNFHHSVMQQPAKPTRNYDPSNVGICFQEHK